MWNIAGQKWGGFERSEWGYRATVIKCICILPKRFCPQGLKKIWWSSWRFYESQRIVSQWPSSHHQQKADLPDQVPQTLWSWKRGMMPSYYFIVRFFTWIMHNWLASSAELVFVGCSCPLIFFSFLLISSLLSRLCHHPVPSTSPGIQDLLRSRPLAIECQFFALLQPEHFASPFFTTHSEYLWYSCWNLKEHRLS